MFILDTDHIGAIQWQSEPEYSRLMKRISQHPATAFYVTITSYHEEILGWNAYISKAKSVQGVVKGYERLLKIITDFNAAQVLPFDDAAASEFMNLRSQKTRIGTMDLRIASIALARQMILLSRNLRDFTQVAGLQVEDWTAP